MRNDKFFLTFDEKTGGIAELYLTADADGMNWVKPPLAFGVPTYVHNVRFHGKESDFILEAWEERENGGTAYYRTEQVQTRPKDAPEGEIFAELRAKTEYTFDECGNLRVRTVISNASRWQKFFMEGDIALRFNFFDDYYDAMTCMTSRCTAHLWCGGDSSWVCALKMGESEQNVGLVFTEGGAVSYSQSGCQYSDRGYFTMNLALKMLRPGEEATFTYVLFPHTGKADFLRKLAEYPHCAVLSSDNFTYFVGETVRLRAENVSGGKIAAHSDLPLLSEKQNGACTEFTFAADSLGEHRIDVTYGKDGECGTYAKVFVSEDVETVLKRRLDFIIDKQQYREEGNTLDGAFLCYDAESGEMYYDEQFSDHNAQRERLGMTILLANYLQTHENEKYREALERSLAFVYREVLNFETGEVFNFAHRYSTWIRPYNYPWVALLLCEAYGALGKKEMLSHAAAIMEAYYKQDGKNFYPTAIFMSEWIHIFREAGMIEESTHLEKKFLEHVETMIERGMRYPKLEVNYEQSIVAPAVSFITDAYSLTGDSRYLSEVKPHIAALERFDGLQPHYMLSDIAVRYWDDYWFGKIHTYGDTLPHYWSTLSSVDYLKYADAAEDADRRHRGECGLRNCLCLFMRDGSASCARLYPFEVNGTRGERFDPLCNDQDFALYFAYKYLPKHE